MSGRCEACNGRGELYRCRGCGDLFAHANKFSDCGNPACEGEPFDRIPCADCGGRAAAVDAKYGEVTTTGRQLHPGEPVFILRATDPMAPQVIRWYSNLCFASSCPDKVVAEVRAVADRMDQWQRDNPALVKPKPD